MNGSLLRSREIRHRDGHGFVACPRHERAVQQPFLACNARSRETKVQGELVASYCEIHDANVDRQLFQLVADDDGRYPAK